MESGEEIPTPERPPTPEYPKPLIYQGAYYDDFEKQYKHIWVVKKEKNTSPAELRKKRLKASGWDVIKCRRYGNTEPELTPMAELLRNVMVTGTVPLSQRTSREKLIQFFVKLNLYNLRTSVEKL